MGPWIGTVREWLKEDKTAPRKQRHTARRIWERLCQEKKAGVAGSTVRQTVRELRMEVESGIAEVMIVGCHAPGAEAEVDFGEATVIVAGEPMVVHLFHLRLSASARSVTLAYLSEDQQALLEGHAVALSRLGGVPGRIRYDNLPAAVSRILEGRGRIETDRFVTLRSHFGFESFFCEPGEQKPRDKAYAPDCTSWARLIMEPSPAPPVDRRAASFRLLYAAWPHLQPHHFLPRRRDGVAGMGSPHQPHAWCSTVGRSNSRSPLSLTTREGIRPSDAHPLTVEGSAPSTRETSSSVSSP